ncbi:hypothetical protein IWT140_01572 [Secundilactobacillus pentosiphilus]|uniref:Gram-positive cocci surface proteins LPxTG domain-containing protein n=1 Tax=Secundilactobacillus pentosiphilus TaxID=1714682 RepID=A0A1Z5IQP1_9LACO|nr:LPXTG cell wall anchor domain-containing protein [Secundilactobacillus pentosiphilus]GAX03938.1 hypothetical protein IWT140_01572 [Secundilactobacillus pentosiphilus]
MHLHKIFYALKGDSNTVYTGLVITNVSGDSPSKLRIVRSDGTSQDVSATSYAANNNASWYQFDEPVKVGDKIVITGTNTHNPTLGNSINVVYAKLYGKLSSNPAPDTVAKFVTDFDYQVRNSTGDVMFQSTTPHEDVIYTGSENYFQSAKHGIGSDAIIKQLDQGITLDTDTSTLNNVVPAGQDINTDDYGSIGRVTNDYFTITNGTEDSIAKHITAQPLTGYLAVSNNVSVNTSALTRLLGVSANNIHVYRDTNDPNLNIIKIDNVRPDAIPRLSSMIVTNPGNTGMAVNVLDQVNNYVSTGSVYTVSPTALPNTTLSIPKSIYLTTNKAAIGATDSSYFDQNMLANATFLTSKVAAPTVYSQEASIKGSGDSSATDTGFVDTAKSRTATVTQVLYNGGNTPINTVSANIDLSDANAGILLGGVPTITNIADNSKVPADVTYQDIDGNNTTDVTKAVKAMITIGTTATNATATLLHGAGYQIQYQLTIPNNAQLNNTQKYAIKLSTTDLDSANTPLTDNLQLRVSQTATQTIRVKEMLADTLPANVKNMTAQITGIAGDSITPDYSTLTLAINNLGNYNILGLFDSQGNKVTAVTLSATNPDLYVEIQNKAVKQITTNVDIPSNKGPQNVPNVTGITGQTVDVTVPNLPGYTKDKTTVPATVNPDGTITVDTPNKVTGDKGYVTYTPDAQKINVKFVDQNGTQLGQVTTLTGVSDGEVNLDPAIKAEQALINTGYTPSKGDNNGLDSITKTFTDYGKVPTYIVELSNIRSVEVDKVPRNNVPFANVYTVDYVTPNGKVVGTTTLVGNPGDKHDLTPNLPKGYVPVPGESGNITINKGQDPKTPIIFNVTTPAGQDSDGIQTWTKAQVPDSSPYANQYTINFITPGGKVVGTTTVVGNPGDKHDLTPDLPKGYVPVPGESGNTTINKGQDPKTPIIFNVTTPAGQDSDGIQTWTKAQVPDSSPYANRYTINFITPGGKVVGTTTVVGNPGNLIIVTGNVPNGYTLAGGDGRVEIPNNQAPSQPINVTVIPNSPSGASSTTPNTTTATANSAGNPTSTSTVKPITNVNRDSYNNGIAKGSALQKNTAITDDHDHTWSVPTGSDKSNNNAQTKFTSQSSHAQAGLVHSNRLKPDTEKSKITALPQTNEQEASVWAMLGLGLISLWGLFGFTKQRKREDDR